jgi:acid phosphatase type 7
MRKLGTALVVVGIVLVGIVLAGGGVGSVGARAETGAVVTAAGDICKSATSPGPCRKSGDLIRSIGPTVALTLGDNQYPDGTLSAYNASYDKAWGSFKGRTDPVPGNHEYHTANAGGYRSYFGVSGPTWYSYNVGAWHMIALDSNCTEVGGCGRTSAQYAWLEADLAADTHDCTLAYWHHPRYSSGTKHGGTTSVEPFWALLVADRAELVLNGHEHHYERFAPQRGITEFVIGTGGRSPSYPFGSPEPNSVKRIRYVQGVGRFTLAPNGWTMSFVAVDGSVKDTASGSCA